MSNKLKIEHNLFLDMNSSSNALGGWAAALPAPVGSNGQANFLIQSSRGYSNIQFNRNTVDGIATSGSNTNNLMFTDPSQFANGKANRLDFANNLINASANTRTMSDSAQGSAGLDARYEAWFFDGNVITAGNTSSNKPVGLPANAYPESESSIGWQKASAKNFRVKYDSTFFQAGKGADIAALEAEQGKVSNPRVMRITSTTARIGYYAPDSAACTIEYSTSATSGTGMRVSDGGGHRVRNVSLSGLSPDTPYYIRVLCAAEQPSLQLRTAP